MTWIRRGITWLPVASAAAIAMLVYVAWLVAFFQLGRRPRPSLDDPDLLGGFATAVHKVSVRIEHGLVWVWIVSAAACVILGCWPRIQDRKSAWIGLLAGLCGVAGLIALINYSPDQAFTWYLD